MVNNYICATATQTLGSPTTLTPEPSTFETLKL